MKNINKYVFGILFIFGFILLWLNISFKKESVEIVKIEEKNILKSKPIDKKIEIFRSDSIKKVELNNNLEAIKSNSIKNIILNKYNLSREELILNKRRAFRSLLDVKDKNLKQLFEGILNNDYELILQLHKKGIDFKKLVPKLDFLLKLSGYFISDFRIIDILLEQGLSPLKIKGNSCLETALESKNFAFLEYLINNKNININDINDRFSLKMQAFGNKDLEEWILKNGVEYNDYDRVNFYKKLNGYLVDKSIIEKYENEGFEFSDEVLSHLLLKVSHIVENSVKTFKYIDSLAIHIDKDIRDRYGNTALLKAVGSHSNLDSVKWLVENGYDMYAENSYGENALGKAFRIKRMDAVFYLLENNMNPYSEIKIRGKRYMTKKVNKPTLEDINKYSKYEEIKYKNLYEASKSEGLINLQNYLENNYGF